MTIQQQTTSFLTFKLGSEVFAISVHEVLEIFEIKPITRAPKSPPFMKGVINLRGNILPVVDTRYKFGMEETPDTIDTCIVVLTIGTGNDALMVGAIVDSVLEVIDIPNEKIQPAPAIGISFKEDFIRGMGKIEEEFVMILNIDKVFSTK
jgi:purine-binding chemotaxis protein CheW